MIRNIYSYLPPRLQKKIAESININTNNLLEIRLRVNQPINIITEYSDIFIKNTIVTVKDLKEAVLILSENSIYALERQFKEGFITIKGGHRVGFTGQVIADDKGIKTIKNINSINYRLSRQIIGTAEKVVKRIFDYEQGSVYNTLIIAPPICGKTTLLRDLVRLLSTGSREFNIPAQKIGLVDERSEIAGAYKGIPQNDIGKRTDVLDNCPKSEGIMLLIRAMSPEVIVVDELGKEEDLYAVKEAAHAGVSLITTLHGKNLKTIKYKPSFGELINYYFSRYIILSRKNGVGTVEKILNKKGERI